MSTETRPITPLPAGFTWGHVTGRIIHALGDTAADPDKTPEARGAAGTVTFTPLGHPPRAHGVLVMHERVTVTLDADGYIVDAHGDRAPIALLIGAYSVAFNLDGGQVPGFPIEVTTAHTIAAPLDLATVAPYMPPTGATVTTLVVPASPSEGYALGWQDGKLAWLPGGGGGGVTDHGLLTGLGDDDHSLYALADGTRGAFAPPLGPDDNYVTDAEKAALHSHANKTALDAVSGVNTGDQDLSGYATTASLATVATSGSYADLTGTPTIPDSPDDIGAAPATHDHTAADIDSGAATDGHILTADGAGGTAWEAPPAGGGGGTGAVGVTANDTPSAPAEGESASYLVTSAVVWPADLVWSTDPDGGVAPTITGTALVSLFTVDGTTRAIMGATFPAPPDTTAPAAGTLAVVPSSISALGTVTGASDAVALAAAPYSFRLDAGAWSAWQASASYSWTGLTASTAYTFQHRVRDAAGNITEGTAVTDTTDAPAVDSTPPTVGTMAVSGISDTGFTLTIAGAADETALDAAPYSFTTDGGTTWTAYQASPVYAASGLAAETAYSVNWRVRDAAGNVSTGTAQTVTTGAAAPPTTLASDDFNRANGLVDGSTAVTGQTWEGGTAVSIASNAATAVSAAGGCVVAVGQPDMMVTVSTTTTAGPIVRCATHAPSALPEDYYRCLFLGGSWYITRLDGATVNHIHQFAGSAPTSTVGLRAVTNGAAVDLTVYRDGVAIGTYSDTSASRKSGTYAGMYLGKPSECDNFVAVSA